ncbi:hypothetical protein ACE1ET_20445 [Saccharicrinis sp. FJH62]|uniref:hypothetical protein n=1 Tax=Saccharicrinis sp. FJH62 TaxID=3344657 RepID=UPI0035D4F93A
MTEKIRRINNPLTIIAIFAALAEVNATVSLGLIPESLQGIFIWFVLGFPTFLVAGFFITLNFNPKVLYAPSDFKDEQNFINTLTGKFNQKQVNITKDNISEIETILDSEILDDVRGVPGNASEMLKFGNDYFKELIENMRKKLEEENIFESFGFGIQAEDLFLLSLRYNKDRFPRNFANEQEYVIRFLIKNNKLFAEIPRLNLIESNYKTLAKETFRQIEDTLEKHLDKKTDL